MPSHGSARGMAMRSRLQQKRDRTRARSGAEAGPDPFAGGVAGDWVDGVEAVAPLGGERLDDVKPSAAVGVEGGFRQVEVVQAQLDHGCRNGRFWAGVPYLYEHRLRIPAAYKT